jgi:hypothetical protein
MRLTALVTDIEGESPPFSVGDRFSILLEDDSITIPGTFTAFDSTPFSGRCEPSCIGSPDHAWYWSILPTGSFTIARREWYTQESGNSFGTWTEVVPLPVPEPLTSFDLLLFGMLVAALVLRGARR